MRIKIVILFLFTLSSGVLFAQRRQKDYITELRTTYNVEIKTDKVLKNDPQEVPEFTNTINDTLEIFVDSMKVIYGKGVGRQAHSILAYNGTDGEEALKIRRQILMEYPEAVVDNKWDSPNWKVKVGPFFDKLKAVRIKEGLRKKGHSNVLIIPDTIFYREGKVIRN